MAVKRPTLEKKMNNQLGQGADIIFTDTTKEEDVSNDGNIDRNVSGNNSDDVDGNVNNDISEDISTDDSIDVSDDDFVSVDRNVIENNLRNMPGNIDRNNSGIVIKRAADKDKVVRVSYYLKPSTIKQIEKMAKQAGMKISPFLQTLLDEALSKIKIEE